MYIFGVLGVKPNTNKVYFIYRTTARGIKPRAIVKIYTLVTPMF